MIAARLPAGYVLYRGLGHGDRALLTACLLGSVAPDFDLIWFYLVDSSIHHHRLWPHVPFYGLALLAPAAAAYWRSRSVVARWLTVFAMAGMLHTLLDTMSGGIMWLWPLSDHLFTPVTVPATQSHWVLSFILHWTFLAEVAIVLLASWLLFFRRRWV